ncbi:MAG TPA: diaminopimelate epimerase [Armatimonadetes bacterium]|nr:diaminopimelate epimerase [Armatimonadota bacterium]
MSLRFYKLHGLGNDFVLFDATKASVNVPHWGELARRICDRHFGVGADGVLLVLPPTSHDADLRMRIINADGSEAEMCGNGIRCFAKWAYEHGKVRRDIMRIETLAGVKTVRLLVESRSVIGVEVNMGKPSLRRSDIPMMGDDERAIEEQIEVDGHRFTITAVSMGNPHCVIFVDDVATTPVEKWGPMLEYHPLFPQRTNVEFVQVVSSDKLKVRVWERGAGITLACGTGACASLVAAVITNRTGRQVTVHLPGGQLQVRWAEDDQVYMMGPAQEVFEGNICDAWLETMLV